MKKVPLRVALYDLMHISSVSRGKGETLKQKDLETMLWEHGMQIKKGYLTTYGEFRSIVTNKIVTTEIYESEERNDKEWKQSGNISIEAYTNA